MATMTVVKKSVEIVNDVLDILRKTEGQITFEVWQVYTQRLESAHNVLNNAAVKLEHEGELALGAQPAISWASPVRECMDGLNSEVIIPLSKCIKYSNSNEWKHFSNCFHDVRAKVEELSRMIKMIDDPTQQELEKMLWWVSELGTKEHLGWLIQVRHKLPDGLKELEEIADSRVSKRVSEKYDPDEGLQIFFDLDQRQFAHIVSNPDWTKEPSTSSLEHPHLNNLNSIREKLVLLFPEAQIKQWLRTPNPRLNDKSPIAAIKEGQTLSVLQLLATTWPATPQA